MHVKRGQEGSAVATREEASVSTRPQAPQRIPIGPVERTVVLGSLISKEELVRLAVRHDPVVEAARAELVTVERKAVELRARTEEQ